MKVNDGFKYVEVNIWKSMSDERHMPVYALNTNYVFKIQGHN